MVKNMRENRIIIMFLNVCALNATVPYVDVNHQILESAESKISMIMNNG